MRTTVNITDGRLRLGDTDLGGLARERGTPLYVYDGDAIGARAASLLASLRGCADAHYSIKANPSPAIASLMRRAGLGAEIASAGELAVARRAGFAPDHILFAGPGKTDDELSAAIDAGVGQINAESERELQRIDACAHARGITQRVGIRVNPERGAGAIATSGGAQKFGIDPDRLAGAIGLTRSLGSLSLGGVHAMLGSQILDMDAMLDHARWALSMVDRVRAQTGGPIPTLNLGGGLGAPHAAGDASFDLDAFGAALAEIAAAHPETRLVLEPGRVLLSDLGVYLTRVVDVKDSHGERVVILDGGINHAMLPITANTYRVVRAEYAGEPGAAGAIVGGPLCTSADQWRPEAPIAGAEVGEIVAMLNAGAYALSASMTMFLSRPIPEEVLLLGGEAHVIRARSRPEDVLAGQSIPAPLGTA